MWKKLLEQATKKPSGVFHGLKAEDVNPRLAFHYGIPAGATSLAYDPIQKITAISTNDGRIKLFGKDNSQALLESSETVPSKFLEFFNNDGILVNINAKNHIEVWDLQKKQLMCVWEFDKDISSLNIIQRSPFMYIGDIHGNVTVMNIKREICRLEQMQYTIPFEASHGHANELAAGSPVMSILPQPLAESKRVLLIFGDGQIALWEVSESIAIFTTGGTRAVGSEVRKATSACWACSCGSKIVVGYNNGDILIWGIPVVANQKNSFKTEKEETCAAQNVPVSKLNLGYKMDKIPITFLRWVSSGGQTSRLYVNGVSENGSLHSFQIISLQESYESRIVKLVLPLPKPCKSMALSSSTYERDAQKHNLLFLLLEPGHLYVFDDSQIEKYLLLSQQLKTSSLPNHIMAKIPFIESAVTVSKLFTNISDPARPADEDHGSFRNFPKVIPLTVKEKDGSRTLSSRFQGFTKIINLYITGHSNGTINFWDASYPLFHLLFSVQQQSEEDHSPSGVPVTFLFFDINLRVLVSGDQNGMVRIFKFKPEQGGCSCNISGIKLIKVIGSVTSINVNSITGHLLVGSDEGCVAIIDMEGSKILSQKRFTGEQYTGIISVQPINGRLNVENILLVALKDSSVLVVEEGTGNQLSPSIIRPKKPAKALFMDVLDGQSLVLNGLDSGRVNGTKDYEKQLLVLLCSERVVRLYSFVHLMQGIKKVQSKKKLNGTCCFASTFSNPTLGLILLFTDGKVELRSLPELSLLKRTWMRGIEFQSSISNLEIKLSFSVSSNGEIVAIKGNQEIFLISTLSREDTYRRYDLASQVYDESVLTQDVVTPASSNQKEKKKGFFSVVMNDMKKGNKSGKSLEVEVVDSEVIIRELATIFSTSSFSLDDRRKDAIDKDEDVEIDIDDIELDDADDKPKNVNISKLDKKMLTGKIQALKNKLKPGKLQIGHLISKEEPKEEKGTMGVDDIKRKYGFPLAADSNAAKLSQSKLNDHLKKLEDTNTKATELQDAAQSFSVAANDLLRSLDHTRSS